MKVLKCHIINPKTAKALIFFPVNMKFFWSGFPEKAKAKSFNFEKHYCNLRDMKWKKSKTPFKLYSLISTKYGFLKMVVVLTNYSFSIIDITFQIFSFPFFVRVLRVKLNPCEKVEDLHDRFSHCTWHLVSTIRQKMQNRP